MSPEQNFDPNKDDINLEEQEDFAPIVRKQEQLRTTIGRVVQNDPLAAKRFQDLVGRALSKRLDNEDVI
jgi:hypothetical protein